MLLLWFLYAINYWDGNLQENTLFLMVIFMMENGTGESFNLAKVSHCKELEFYLIYFLKNSQGVI